MFRKVRSTLYICSATVGLMLASGAAPSTAFAAVTFDPVTDELAAPTVIDDFTEDLSKWTTSGSVSIQSSSDSLQVGDPSAGSAILREDYRIPLPEIGEILIVEASIRGRAHLGGQSVILSNGDGVSGAMIRASTGDEYDARPAADSTADNLRTTTEDYVFGDPDTLRFVFDNVNGDRVVSLYVKKYGDTTYTQLEWDANLGTSSGPVTQANAWSSTDPLWVEYLTTGGTRMLRSEYVQYEIIPEPASLALMGAGGLLLLSSRRFRKRVA
ncbi:PEP-CTERM sorting domain-containing protein [Phycisphaerales bacterium AB-hyl4]|uniref:PEP-CTERM sorting domain-containing protein n=1 Tax=Natronomicrosphaera hydrolytica TaxID=3242702 RepID=A0ABV4U5K5_9BACT